MEEVSKKQKKSDKRETLQLCAIINNVWPKT